ncbi:hypothetical protein [Pyxidicoccus trucidator]|uniref:hypothetical protein n=1 Tax=Pyxidicoccus trucidator TaxID=2709662 RepID=UPI0013DBE6E8|nr:hypothetical protein [Pyxidicoccus trucidator]
MSKLLRSLLAATAFLTLAPTAASALPPQCYEECDFEYSECTQPCARGGTLTTCGAYGVCAGAREEPSDASASVSQDEARQSVASQVCGEEQTAEVSSSAES